MIKRDDKLRGENYKFVPRMSYKNNTNENTENAGETVEEEQRRRRRRRREGVALQKLERRETAPISGTMPSAGVLSAERVSHQT